MISQAEKVKSQMVSKKFIRLKEGAALYSVGINTFQSLAKEANAIYKVGKMVLVNTEILDEYLEKFKVTGGK